MNETLGEFLLRMLQERPEISWDTLHVEVARVEEDEEKITLHLESHVKK